MNKYIAQAAPSLDRNALYAICKITPAEATDHTRMVRAQDFCDLVETLAAADGPEVGINMRTCGSMRCDDYGATGMAFKSAPTLRQSFWRVDRYARLFNKISQFDFLDQGDEVWLVNKNPAGPRLGYRLANEAALGTFVSLCRETASPAFCPRRVTFMHEPQPSRTAVEAFFNAPVEYGAAQDALILSSYLVDQPNVAGDATIWSFFATHLEEYLPGGEDEFDRQVMQQVAELLSEGVPTLETVAAALGTGSRTLQRRLSERGKTFRSVVDEARQELAKQLVADPKYSLAEIAFLTGFSEQSSFTRAFRRYTGQTPRAFRLNTIGA